MTSLGNVLETQPYLVPNALRPAAIRALKKMISVLNANEDKSLMEIGIQPEILSCPERREEIRLGNLDRAHWQLVLFLRYIEPSQIRDAVEHCRWVLDHLRDGVQDPLPQIMLAVSLSANDKNAEAIKYFEKGFASLERGTNSGIWGMAHWARTLRKIGQMNAAEKLEQELAEWYNSHPYAMPPSQFAKLVLEEGEESNSVLQGIPGFGQTVREFENGILVVSRPNTQIVLRQ